MSAVDEDSSTGAPPRIAWNEPDPAGYDRPHVVHAAVNPVGEPQVSEDELQPVGTNSSGTSNCWSRVPPDGRPAAWTMCYRWGRGPSEDPSSPAISPDGRWAVDTTALGETIVFDARTGRATGRFEHAGRAQSATFEDADHYLAVITREPTPDAWPDEWITRCDVRGRCERATPVILVRAYDTLDFERYRDH